MVAMALSVVPPQSRDGHYRWLVGDLRTGRIGKTIDVKGSWSTVFDGADTLSAQFPIYAFRNMETVVGFGEGYFGMGPFGEGELSQVPRQVWPDAISDSTPGKAFLAVAWVDGFETEHWLAGGPIWVQDFDEASGTMTLGAAGLESYYDHRYVLPVLVGGQKPQDVTSYWQAAQLGLIAKRLVEQAHSWTAGAPPVVLPSDASLGGAGTAHERTYPGYELGKVGQRLRQLSDVENGPEIQFAPRRRTDDPRFMEWVMRVGVEASDMMLSQAGPAWLIDATVPKNMVANIRRTVDGSVLVTDAYAAGQGQGEGRPIEVASSSMLTDAGFLRLEGEKQSTDSVSNADTLLAHAEGFLARRGRPAEKLTVTVDAQTWWKRAAGARAGDWLTLKAEGRVAIQDGTNDLRILAISANDDATVDLACVTKREAVDE